MMHVQTPCEKCGKPIIAYKSPAGYYSVYISKDYKVYHTGCKPEDD